MKKIISVLIVSLLALMVVSCNKTSETYTTSDDTTPDISHTGGEQIDIGKYGDISASTDGNYVLLSFVFPDNPNAEASIILLRSGEKADNTDAILAIDQITLDDKGKGDVKLPVEYKGKIDIIVTASDGKSLNAEVTIK